MDILLYQWYSPIIGLAGLFLAVFSIVLAIIFYRRSQRFKEPCWAIKNIVLIEGYSTKISDLEVTYKDQRIENLSVSRIVIWNEGKETIDGKDIAQANPLRISTLDDVHILDAKVIATNNPSSQFDVLDDEKVALLKFDYIDHKQGGVLQLVHTGNKSTDLILEGDIKGAKLLRRVKIPIFTRFHSIPPYNLIIKKGTAPSKVRRLIQLLMIFVGFLTFALAVIVIFFPPKPEFPSAPTIINSILRLLLFFSLSIFSLIYFYTLFIFFRRRIPRGLEIFDEEILSDES